MNSTFKLKQLVPVFLVFLVASQANASERALVQFQAAEELEVTVDDSRQGIVGKYVVDVDSGTLYESFNTTSSWTDDDQTEIGERNAFVLFPTDRTQAPELSISLRPDRSENYIDGVDTFSGSVNADENASFVFSVENHQVSGRVRLDDYLISLRYDEALDSQVLTIIDLRLAPKNDMEADYGTHDIQSKSQTYLSAQPSSYLSSNQGNIRVLFYYTAKAANRNNIYSMVANILSELNTSIDMSDINPDIDFTSASIKQLGSNLDGLCRYEYDNQHTIHSYMRNRTSPFNVVNSDLAQYDADISLIIATTEPTYDHCSSGFGRIGGIAADIFDDSQPLAMTTDTFALGDLTAIHELGHVIGGNHEPGSPHGNASGTPVYAKGHVSSTDNWQTIMGGYYECDFDFDSDPSQQPCVRINRWSNPAISYQGESTGSVNVSDMESALEITAPIVSGWASFPTPTPTATPSIQSPGNCPSISWSMLSGSTHYQVFKSSSSSFPGGGDRVSITILPSVVVSVPFNQTEYVRVRACNGNGCGSYSNTLTITNDINCT